MTTRPPTAMPAIAPESSGPLRPGGVKVAVAVGSVTFNTLVENMLPWSGMVAGGSSLSLQAPSKTDMTVTGTMLAQIMLKRLVVRFTVADVIAVRL